MLLKVLQDLGSLLSINQNSASAAILSSIICIAAFASYHYHKNVYSYWKKKGLNGPAPWPVIGNIVELFLGDRMKQSLEWPIKYGKIYGAYIGSNPLVFINDPEVMQQICIHDFDAFPNHEVNEFFNDYQKAFLFFAQDATWKKLRVFMSPTFTSVKIKRMFKLLDKCADDLILCYREQLVDDNSSPTGRSAIVDVREVYKLYTMDTIASCCCGIKMKREGCGSIKRAASRNNFVRIAMNILDLSPPRFMLGAMAPAKLLHAFDFKVVPYSAYQPYVDIMRKIIDSRRSTSDKKFNDYLQMLIDTKLDQELELNDTDLSENHHAGLTHESLIGDQRRMLAEVKNHSNSVASKAKIELSELEILSSAMIFMVVGVETTSNLLTNSSYLLAFHPDIQDRLYNELKSFAKFDEDDKTYSFDYDDITSSHYLDAFVSESLRFFPPILLTERISSVDYRIEKYNLDLPKGSKVNLVLYYLMNSPDYWLEPQKFNPDRFMPGNKEKIIPGSYCPFGIGPRHCIGMRFSLTETKLAIAKILLHYRICPAPNTEFPPKFKTFIAFSSMKKPKVRLIPR